MTAATPQLSVRDLQVQLSGRGTIVEEFDLELQAGEIVGLVGESGSGKTSSALALLGYGKRGVEITSGDLRIGDRRVAFGDAARDVRGSLISYVPQDPGPALNPSLRIEAAIEDVVRAHRPAQLGPHTASDLLRLVGLPADEEFRQRFPHQLSGGQQQRVCIALALACEPAVVVLDEPTTGLDVLTEARILDELGRYRDQRGVSMVYVTHNLAVVAKITDRIMVMYAGRVVEQGPTHAVLSEPRHPYTRALLAATPNHLEPRALQVIPGVAVGVGERPDGCAFAPRCPQRMANCVTATPGLERIASERRVRCFEWRRTPSGSNAAVLSHEHPPSSETERALDVRRLWAEYSSRRGRVTVAADISFSVEQGSCAALVGESGSGKTTIARVIAGLHPAAAGEIRLFGQVLPIEGSDRTREQYRRVQLVFQNPAEALNPRHAVKYSIGRPAEILRGLDRGDVAAEVSRLLELVRLPSQLAERYPVELSGGERQRVALARALAASPDLIICDEITSALDVSVQAAILELLRELRTELDLSLLFITHDLGVVVECADRVVVLDRGSVCEQGATVEVLRAPQHQYTNSLIEAAPSVAAGGRV